MASASPHTCPHTSAEPPHARSVQKRFTDAQIRQYIQYIGLPEPFASSPIVSSKDHKLAREGEHVLPFLAALMRFHMARIPFENIALHYTSARVVTLDMDEVFERMIGGGRGLGGYCFQHNALFGAVLRTLGFDIMATAGRVNTACEPVAGYPNYVGASYNAWNHQISIVTINAKDYLVDVGMGAWGPMVPVELREGNTGPTIAPRHMRLTRGCIPEYESCRESNKVWHYEARNEEGQPWGPIYCFSMLEFLPVDFRALNWFVSTSRQSWFTALFICAKLVLNDAGTEIVGDLTLFGNGLRKRINAKTVLELEFKNEGERVKALSDHFGINLSAPEQAAILETATAL